MLESVWKAADIAAKAASCSLTRRPQLLHFLQVSVIDCLPFLILAVDVDPSCAFIADYEDDSSRWRQLLDSHWAVPRSTQVQRAARAERKEDATTGHWWTEWLGTVTAGGQIE